jgi:hypothetical protein
MSTGDDDRGRHHREQLRDVSQAVIVTVIPRSTGRFSLVSRRDQVKRSTRPSLTRRPVADLRHAFELDDYNVDGRLSGEFHVATI